jgi:hypothetical protein
MSWNNELCTIPRLAELTGEKRAKLYDELRCADPPPTIQKGKRVKLWLADYYDWTHKHYGVKGDLRGSENFDIEI